MRLVCVLLLCACVVCTQEIAESNENVESSDQNLAQESVPTQENTISIFSPAPVVKESYASFAIGYQMLFKESFTSKENGMFFSLDRGWNFVDNMLLFGFSLDGTTGNFYSLNANAKLSARTLGGRLIPSISFGYGLLNHYISNDEQYNLHGANGTIGLFVDIARGFGIEAAYRVGLHPFHTTKKNSNIKISGISMFMINVKFMDFSF